MDDLSHFAAPKVFTRARVRHALVVTIAAAIVVTGQVSWFFAVSLVCAPWSLWRLWKLCTDPGHGQCTALSYQLVRLCRLLPDTRGPLLAFADPNGLPLPDVEDDIDMPPDDTGAVWMYVSHRWWCRNLVVVDDQIATYYPLSGVLRLPAQDPIHPATVVVKCDRPITWKGVRNALWGPWRVGGMTAEEQRDLITRVQDTVRARITVDLLEIT